MQSILNFLSFLGIAALLLVLSELMIKRLIWGLESALDFFFGKRERTISFSLFSRSQFLWQTIFLILWILSGIFASISIVGNLDNEIMLIFLIFFYLMGELRLNRSNQYIQQVNSRIKWTANWQEFELYRTLVETENPAFIDIINDVEQLKQLERVARHSKNAILFDPKQMRWLTSREEIEPRLRNHIKFLMSEERSESFSQEEIYVIVFILAEKEDCLANILQDILSQHDWMQVLSE